MKMPSATWDARKVLACVALGWVLAGSLGGCAFRPGGVGKDTVTESDETEPRRRARIRMELALGYFEQGQAKVALDEVKQVISIDPDFPDAHNLRGLIYMRLNDFPQAEESFRRAVALNPKDPNVRHNYGWLQCQEGHFDDAQRSFDAALADPLYTGRAKTLLAQGVCQARAGKKADAERSLARAYELDAANPVTGYTLANLLFQRGDFARSQFYIRRLNNTELANAESLWLGIKVERRLDDRVAMRQLGEQLKKRFPQTREAALYDKGAFDE